MAQLEMCSPFTQASKPLSASDSPGENEMLALSDHWHQPLYKMAHSEQSWQAVRAMRIFLLVV